jgi:hypothetical protein
MCLGYGGEQKEIKHQRGAANEEQCRGSGQKERAGVSAECGVNADQCMREKASSKHIDDAAK